MTWLIFPEGIDGVGFQMHVLPDCPSIDAIKSSWSWVLQLNYGLKIKITELDMRVNNRYGGNTDNPQPAYNGFKEALQEVS